MTSRPEPDPAAADLAAADLAAVACAGSELSPTAGLLVERWSQDHRRYHDLRHLTEVLAALDAIAASGALDARGRAVARVAAWYHDAVYDVHAAAGVTERLSADLAAEELTALGAPASVASEVVQLVLDTARPDHDPQTATGRAFHDADLWILSSAESRYRQYREAVREEYRHVPEEHFRPARAQILQGIAARDRIYATAAAAPWEEPARRNLADEIAWLTA